jgi:hypothetical protein
MDEAQIKALITSTIEGILPTILKPALAEFTAHFQKVNKDIIDKLDSFEVVADEQPKKVEGANDPVAARLAKLEKAHSVLLEENKQKDLAAQRLLFENELSSTISSRSDVIQQNLLKEVLVNRLKDGAVQKDGKWLTKDGSLLTEAVTNFFGTEEGSHFIRSSHENGTGTQASKVPTGTKKSMSEITVDEMLAEGLRF